MTGSSGEPEPGLSVELRARVTSPSSSSASSPTLVRRMDDGTSCDASETPSGLRGVVEEGRDASASSGCKSGNCKVKEQKSEAETSSFRVTHPQRQRSGSPGAFPLATFDVRPAFVMVELSQRNAKVLGLHESRI